MATIDPSDGWDRSGSQEVISLFANSGDFGVPGDLWCVLLNLAQKYGWKPAGTLPPLPEDDFDGLGGDGSYYPPNGQRMTTEDARNFAHALERLLVDIPDGCESEADAEGNPYAGWLAGSSDVIQRLATIRSTLHSLVFHCQEELWLI